MKKFVPLILAASLCVVSFGSTAYASRSKLLVMGTGDAGLLFGGTGNGGSFFYDDPYNMFYNPSYIAGQEDWITIEKSNSPGRTAEGGFKTSFLNFGLGLFINRVSPLSLTGYTNSRLMHPVDFIIGADMGFKWGLSVSTAAYSDTTGKTSDTTLRAGAQVSDLEPFLAWQTSGKDPAIEYDHFLIGSRYKWGEWIPHAAYQLRKTADVQSDIFGVGLGRASTFGEGGKVFFDFAYWRSTVNNRSIIPLHVAAEATLITWLTLRAGVEFHLLDQTGGFDSATDTTTGRIGATIHVGAVDLDWAIGFADISNNGLESVGTNGNTAIAPQDSQQFSIANGFFTAAGLTVKW